MKIIHVYQQRIRQNIKAEVKQPPIIIREGSKREYAFRIKINGPVITLENYTTSNSQAWATPVIEIDGDTQLVFINVTNSSTNNVSFVAHLTLQSSFMHSNYTWHTLIIEQGSAFDTTDASL